MTQPYTVRRHLAEKSSELKNLVEELDRAVMEERQERLVLPEGHYAFLPLLG